MSCAARSGASTPAQAKKRLPSGDFLRRLWVGGYSLARGRRYETELPVVLTENREKLVFLRAFDLADGSGPEDPVLNPIVLPRCLDSFEETAQLPVATPPVWGVPSRDLVPPQRPDLGRNLSLIGV